MQDEPRGPHLPDAFARIPSLAWIFITAAIVRLWVLIDTARVGPAPSALSIALVGSTAIASLSVFLLPAVLLVRHPDATSRARVLIVGAVLFAAGEGLQVLSGGLLPILQAAALGSEDTSMLSTAAFAYFPLASMVKIIGLFGIAMGLAAARRRRTRGATRWTVLVVAFAALLASNKIASAWRFLTLGTSTDLANIGSSLVVGFLSIAAWAYLTITTIHGVRNREQPLTGWRLAMLSGALALFAYEMYAVLTVFVVPNADLTGVLFLASALFAIGPLALLLAFAAGLPSLEPGSESAAD